MNDQSKGTGSEDDRNAYRIEDEMELHYRLATQAEMDSPNFNDESMIDHKTSLLRALSSLETESANILTNICDKHKEVGIYLKILDHKVKILAEAICHADSPERELQKVNISETGIAFGSQREFKTGDMLRLQMILRPTYHDIPTLSEVVLCKENNEAGKKAGKPYFIAVNFVEMASLDRQALARHIMRRQTEIRRQLKDEEF